MTYRSFLCINILNKSHTDSLQSLPFDFIHLDLEDGVPFELKKSARIEVVKYLKKNTTSNVALRINCPTTLDGMRDLIALSENKVAPNILIIGKADIINDAATVFEILKEYNPKIKIFVVVETIKAFRDLSKLESRPNNLSGFIFGSADYAAEMGVHLKSLNLDYPMQQLALAGKSLGLILIDSPCFDICSKSELQFEINRARSMGFDGKIAIHPNQVNEINDGFSECISDIEVAKEILKLKPEGNSTISKFNNKMIGPPFRKYSQNLLLRSSSKDILK